MALVRIVVDGKGLLEGWTTVAPGKPRHSAVAREELINRLTQYYDACGTPLTVVFDAHTVGGDDLPPSTPEVEILYSRPGQRVDQVIGRLAQRFQAFGEVLVVSDLQAKKAPDPDKIIQVSDTATFIPIIESALDDLERDISTFNQKERSQFNRTH